MKTLTIVLAAGIMVCSFVLAGVTQDSAQGGAGEAVFQRNCAGCHANGGNVIKPAKPLKGAPAMQKFDTFLAWIRNPAQPMPVFSTSKISDQQAKELYDYILKATASAWK